MHSRNSLHALGWSAVVVVLLSVGIFLYSQWDLKRFNESLPEVPSMATAEKDSPNAEGVTEPVQVVMHLPDTESERRETDGVADTEVSSEISGSDDTVLAEFYDDDARALFEELVEESEVDTASEEGDVSDADRLPYDVEIVKAGFDDYNAYLNTAPAYAYQRLDDAFREQYGDFPDVDILVETIQRSNEGTGTIDDAIANAEAFLRLAQPSVPPENVQEVVEQVTYLRELRQLAVDEGIEIPFQQTYRFGGM